LSDQTTRFKAVLFDLDGTLIEFKFPVKESRLAMFNFLKRNGYKVDHLKENIRTQELFDEAEAQWSASERKKEMHAFPDLKLSLFRILDDFESESIKLSKPLPGCLDAMESLHEAGISMGVVTNSGRAPAISILSDYGYLPYMEVVITRNDIPRMKPSPDGLFEARNLLELENKDMLYVGDSVLDIEAAKSAKIKCASIPTGSFPLEALQRLSPDYILSSMKELEELVLSNRS
jgi:phosphatidylglycerol---prolipoprotein diacylglyceryl transferase